MSGDSRPLTPDEWEELKPKLKQIWDNAITCDQIDWSNPSHVIYVVCEVADDMGIVSAYMDEGELFRLHLAAIDAMPGGEQAMRDAIERTIRELAIEGGYEYILYQDQGDE